MAEVSAPTRNDIAAIFKRLRAQQTNKVCFDCNAKMPTWASVTYGVFICIDCSAIHRSLGVHVSFVRSTNLDTNWTWLQLRMMQVGGNANAMTFFQQHNCTTHDSQQKYNSRAAQLYRDKLHHLAVTAMRTHGTKLHLDSGHEHPTSPEKKEVDFFQEHNEDAAINQMNNNNLIENGSLISVSKLNSKNGAADQDTSVGPNVEAALSTSPSQFQKQSEIRKPTIGMRTAGTAKKGLGAKKGGMGAQRVVTNFSDIEREANLQEQALADEKQQQHHQPSSEEEDKKFVSMRLAYQDLSIQKQKEEDKMRKEDPKKASQMERLGMGFGGRSGSGVTHSAMSDMKTIEQESPNKSAFSSYGRSSRERDYFDDDFEFVGFSSGPPKYGDNPFMVEERFGVYASKTEEKFSSGGGGRSGGSSSVWDSDEPKKQSSFLDETIVSKEPDDSSGRSRRSTAPISSPTTNDAQKKFGNAKAISSDQYFGGPKDMDYERKTNLARFEGSNSISSADYFGDGTAAHHSSGSSYSGPDLEDIREGVRAGVTKVAGKLSSLANGVMNSLQRK